MADRSWQAALCTRTALTSLRGSLQQTPCESHALGMWRHAIDYPQAVIPPLFYESVVINGEVLRWVQWPVKYAMLSPVHARARRADRVAR